MSWCPSRMPRCRNARSSSGTRTTWTRWGLLKVDVLGLGMLCAIRRAFRLINDCGGSSAVAGELDLASVPSEDESVYDMICRADTVGVFQIESRAHVAMLPSLRPRNFYDLMIEVAIVRPQTRQHGHLSPRLDLEY